LPEWRTTGYFSGRHLYARVAAPCADAPFKLTRQLAVPTDWTSRWPDLPFQTRPKTSANRFKSSWWCSWT